MTTATTRPADFHVPTPGRPLLSGTASWLLMFGAAVLAVTAPAIAIVVALGFLLTVGLWRHPAVMAPVLLVLMGNVKINYYTGFFTVFPEYIPLGIASVLFAIRWLEGRERIEEPRIALAFAAFTAAGLLSFVYAIDPARVISKSIVIPIAFASFYFTRVSIRDERSLDRAFAWLAIGATLVAGYGIAQMIGIALGRDLSLGFLRRWGNPDFEYSVGAPVLHQLTSTFRANSLFNDPNILGGYLAATLPPIAARAMVGGPRRPAMRSAAYAIVLTLLATCLLFTLSRSGIIGALIGLLVVVAGNPAVLRNARLWWAAGGALGVALIAAARVGVDSLLLAARLVSTFAGNDFSTRTHHEAFVYGMNLFLRHPLTGVGFRNFGEYYWREVDPAQPSMMAHNAVVSYFAEGGLLAGAAFLLLVGWIVARPLRALGDPALRRDRPRLHAAILGLLGGLAGLAVTNMFYDFSLRTFVWVIAGMAVAASRLAERRGPGPA